MGLFLNVTLFLETMQKFICFMGENRIENKPWYLFEIAFVFLCTFYSSTLARRIIENSDEHIRQLQRKYSRRNDAQSQDEM